MTPPSLFDAEAAADEAIAQVQDHADPEWLAAGLAWIARRAPGELFTTDPVWKFLAAMGVATHEPRAMGALMRAAAREGLVENTGCYEKSQRTACHARPVLVWRRK